MGFTVENKSGAPIKVFISKYSNPEGIDDWSTIENDKSDYWNRTGWELVAIQFNNDTNQRCGVYTTPRSLKVYGKNDIR